MWPNCTRGLVHQTNEFCLECKGTGILQDNVTTMDEETVDTAAVEEVAPVAPEAEEAPVETATDEEAPAEVEADNTTTDVPEKEEMEAE